MNLLPKHGCASLALPNSRPLRRFCGVFALSAALTVTVFAGAASAEDEHLLHAGNGPGPAANGPDPGCNVIPPIATIGTRVDISQFPPPDSLTDPELVGPVQFLKSGKFDLPLDQLTLVNIPPGGSPQGTITLPLYKGAVKTASGLKPAWYIILDTGNQAESERLGVNFSKKLPNDAVAARVAPMVRFSSSPASSTSVRTGSSWPAPRRNRSHQASRIQARLAMQNTARW